MNRHRQELEHWQKVTFPHTLEKMGLGRDAVMVDFGCGEGNYTIAMAEYLNKGYVYGVDTSSYVRQRLQKNKKSMNLDNLVVTADITEVEGNCAEALFVCDLYHSLWDREAMIRQWKRVLKDDGVLVIAPFHMYERSIREMISELERYGFGYSGKMEDAAVHFEMQMYVGSVDDPLETYEHGPFYIFRKGEQLCRKD